MANVSPSSCPGGDAPQLRRHYGRAVRAAAESREGTGGAPPGAKATFLTGDAAGEEADEALSRADDFNAALVEEALRNKKPFVAKVERWENACAVRREPAGGSRLLAKYAGLCLLDEDPFDAHGAHETLDRRLSDSVGQEAFKRTELARAAIARGAPLVEHRVIVGLEWCKFARRWTAVTELRDRHLDPERFPTPEPPFAADTIEKYPLDKALIDYILKSPHNPQIPKKTKPPRKSAAPATPPARNKRLRADRPPPDPAVPATPHVVTSTAGAYATPEQ